MIRAVLLALLLASLGTGSYVALPIERIEVVGNQQLSDAEVRQATGLEPGRPWLWAWPQKLEPLQQNPWIKSATLERPALGQLRIVLEERISIASLIQGSERYGLSSDGMLLPGAPPRSPVLEGRGEIPIADLLLLVRTFPDAQRIRFNVGGYQVLAPNLNVWGKDASGLQAWAEVRKIGRNGASSSLAYLGAPSQSRIYVYSWGVSAR